MTMQPFKIQSPTLSLNGVAIDTSAQGKLVIPGVTRAGTSVAIEVNDTGDQSYAWTGTPVVIDGYTYETTILENFPGQVGWSPAEYAVDGLDGDGYIDGISVVAGGTGYTGEAVTYSQVMYAANEGTQVDPSTNGQWVQIPFSVRCGAGEIQSEFGSGGGGSSITSGDASLTINSNGILTLDNQNYNDVSYVGPMALDYTPDGSIRMGNGDVGIGFRSHNIRHAIAIGNGAQDLGTSVGHYSVVIGSGTDTGYGAKDNSVVIGAGAGFNDSGPVGESSIAIGYYANYAYGHDNSITLNATGVDLSVANEGFFVKPIRNLTGNYALYYDASTGEITYDTASSGGGSTFIPLPTWLTTVSGTHHLPTLNRDYGWDSNGAWTLNATIGGNEPEGTSYPIRTSNSIPGNLTTVVTVDFDATNNGADFGIGVWGVGIDPEWSWLSLTGGNRIGAQYNGTWPELYGISGGYSDGIGGFNLPSPGIYRARLTINPIGPSTANITLETLDTSDNVLNTITYLEESFPTDVGYFIGFASDQDNGTDKTYFKNLTIDVDSGATIVTDALTSYSSGGAGQSQLTNGSFNVTLDANGLVTFPGDMLVGTLWPNDPYDPNGPGGDKESVVWATTNTEYLGLWWGGDQTYPTSGYGPVAGIQIGSDVDNVDDFTDAATAPGTGITIGVNNSTDGTTLKWKFDNTGVLTLPVGGSIVDSNGAPVIGAAGTMNQISTVERRLPIVAVDTELNTVSLSGDVTGEILSATYINVTVAPPQLGFAFTTVEYNSGTNVTVITFDPVVLTVTTNLVTNGDEVLTINVAVNPSGILIEGSAFMDGPGGVAAISSRNISNYSATLTIDPDGNIVLDDYEGGASNRGLVWNWGAKNGGTNASILHNDAGITIQSFTDNDAFASGSPVNIVTGVPSTSFVAYSVTEDGGPYVDILQSQYPRIADVNTTWKAIIATVEYNITDINVNGDDWQVALDTTSSFAYSTQVTFVSPDYTNKWEFNEIGNLILPNGSKLGYAGMGWTGLVACDNSILEITAASTATGGLAQVLVQANNNVTIATGNPNSSVNTWNFNDLGDLVLPIGGTVRDLSGNDITINALAPQLVKANSQIEIRGTLKMEAMPSTFAIGFDSLQNCDVWFNASTADSQGRVWAVGQDGYDNSFLNSYETDGTLRFSLKFNNIDLGGWSGWSNPLPFTIKNYQGNGEYIYVGYTISSHVGVTQFDTFGNVITTWTFIVDDPANSNLDIRSLSIDPDGYPIVIGYQYGQWSIFNNLEPVNIEDSTHAVIGTAYGRLSVLTADIGNPKSVYTSEPYKWSVDVSGSGSWQQPNTLNTFNNIPVENVTGNGGRKDVFEINDFATGGLNIDFTTATPKLVLSTPQWNNGTETQARLAALLAQDGWTLFFSTIDTPDSVYMFYMTGTWVETDPGVSGIWQVEGSLNVIAGPNISTVVHIGNLYYNSTMQVRVGYNIESNGSSYYNFIDVTGGGDRYMSGDIIKIPGSKLGGVDGGFILDGVATTATDNVYHFDQATYPDLQSQLPSGTLFRFWDSGAVGSVLGVNDYLDGTWAVATVMTNGTYLNSGLRIEFFAGNDAHGMIQNNGAYISLDRGLPVQGVMHFDMSYPVEFRGTENTTTAVQGVDFTLGDYRLVSDGSTSWLAVINSGSNDNANLRPNIFSNESITVSFNDPSNVLGAYVTLASDWIIIPGYPTYRGWQLSDNIATVAGDFTVVQIEYGNNTFNGTLWNVRQAQENNAFVSTTNWTRTMGGTGDQGFAEGCYDPNHSVVYATGNFNIPNTSADSVLVAFDYGNGNVLWQVNFDDGTGASDSRSVAVDPSGQNVYLTYENDNSDLVVLKITKDGELVWAKRQDNGNNWNRVPDVVVDSNGDPILVGLNGMYESISDVWRKELNIIKLNKTDGSLVYSNGLTRVTARRDIRSYHQRSNNPATILNDIIYFGGHTDDLQQDFYIGIALSVPANGLELGMYGDWKYHATSGQTEGGYLDISFVDWTSSVTLNSQTFDTSSDFIITVTPGSYSSTVDSGWAAWTSDATTIGGDSKVSFADGSEISQTGISRHMKDTKGGTEITLSAAMNGKFLFYDDNPNSHNSTIHIPASYEVNLPIGYTVTVAMADFNSCVVYVDNNNNGDVWVLASGQDVWDNWYWMFGAGGLPGVYTIMKVDTDTWILSGPDVQPNY